MKQADKRIKFSTFLYSILLIALLYVAGVAVLIYQFGARSGIINKTAEIIPYPAAAIGMTRAITLSRLEKNLDSVRMFYENQDFSDTGFRVDFSTDDGRKRLQVKKKDLLNKMIENETIKMLSRERGIQISSDMVSQEVSRKMEQYGNKEEFSDMLRRLYGWEVEDFEEHIVKPDMYKKELMKQVREQDQNTVAAKRKIEAAFSELEGKNNFEEAAKKYSEGESASKGGELGWFTAEEMLPQIAAVAFTLKSGERSGILESALGYHIVKVEDRKKEEEKEKVRLRQIFVRSENFPEWLIEREKSIRIYIPLREFFWNSETGQVEFSDQSMKEFEANLHKNSQGDISVLF